MHKVLVHFLVVLKGHLGHRDQVLVHFIRLAQLLGDLLLVLLDVVYCSFEVVYRGVDVIN